MANQVQPLDVRSQHISHQQKTNQNRSGCGDTCKVIAVVAAVFATIALFFLLSPVAAIIIGACLLAGSGSLWLAPTVVPVVHTPHRSWWPAWGARQAHVVTPAGAHVGFGGGRAAPVGGLAAFGGGQRVAQLPFGGGRAPTGRAGGGHVLFGQG
jgi:hypothetical protein